MTTPPYKAAVYRTPRPRSKLRPLTATDEIASINTAETSKLNPEPKLTKWQRTKRRWMAYLAS